MKKILLLFLVFGFLFSAQSFPQQISGVDLSLVDSDGEITNGEAYYSNSDGSTLIWVGTYSMEYLEWIQYEKSYSGSGWSKTSKNGLNYYYYCEESYGEVYCMIDCYSGETYYMIDVSMAGENQQEAVNLGVFVGDQLTGGLLGFCPCPLGLVLIGIAAACLVRN